MIAIAFILTRGLRTSVGTANQRGYPAPAKHLSKAGPEVQGKLRFATWHTECDAPKCANDHHGRPVVVARCTLVTPDGQSGGAFCTLAGLGSWNYAEVLAYLIDNVVLGIELPCGQSERRASK